MTVTEMEGVRWFYRVKVTALTAEKVATALISSYTGGGGGVYGGSIIGHGEPPAPGVIGARTDGRDTASKIRLKAGKARQGSVEDGCGKIMIDIKSSPDYLNRSSGGSFDSSYKSSWGSHSSSQSQARRSPFLEHPPKDCGH
uniref:Uncharacterized protein n=1 Tax=Anopheles coluzzii TaxID=1518534 RepID=A0A8W7PG95_ANOCL